MGRRKSKPTKKQQQQHKPVVPSVENLPKQIENEICRAKNRYLFNIEQIEKKYCTTSSGIVLNLTEGKVGKK